MNKIAVLGFDGLDPFILKKHINRLPNLQRLIEEGFFSKLQSTMPPITSSAWTSMVTGKNPGKTGVLGFYQRVGNENQFRSLASAHVDHPRIWDVVHKCGGKSLVLNIPIPGISKINGVYTTGRFGPLKTYPESAAETLLREGYDNSVVDIIKSSESTDSLMENVLHVEHKRLKVGIKLVEESDPDFLFFVFNIPDAIHHIIDDEKMLAHVYGEVDAIVGRFMKIFQNVFIVSDHGFSRKSFEHTFNFLGWLIENGLSDVKVDRVLQLKIAVARILSFLKLYKKNVQTEIHMKSYKINWKKTLVFTEPCLPALYVNKSSELYLDHEKLFHTLKNKFENITHRGKKYEFNLYRREELYKGQKLHLLPEFIIDAPEELVFRDTINPDGIFSSPRVWKRNHSKLLTFIGRGDMIRSGINAEGRIYDICPTILCALGLPLLEDMDGKILPVFSESHNAAYSQELIEIKSSLNQNDEDVPENDEEIERRLKSLGYL